MKAIRIAEAHNVAVVNVPDPETKANDAEIDVKAMGICGSDVHAYAGRSPNVIYPVIVGHETAGIVTKIAQGASNKNGIKVGDRVVLNPYLYCGKCYPCSQSRTNACTSLKCLGVQTDGSMTEKFAHPVDLMVRVPDEVDWETCAVVEPTVIALHAINNVDMKPGEYVVIVGAGCIGQLISIVAMAKGGIPIMVDVVDERLELAKSFGVKHVINSMTQNSTEEIREITSGRMAECVCEVSGAVAGIRNTLDYVASTGRIAFTGWPNKEVSLPTAVITRKEIQIRGSRTGVTSEFQEVLRMVSVDHLDIRKIISRVVDFDGLPEAIRRLDEHPGDDLKVVALNF